ncbi:MliC family protein [Paraburkholderia silvatlantica]|uniref:Membrane-bound inhibitor of C-type lysozyme n=1 Tax=Paraburkholderia silvatlantica TaxID=321895 RepID=A0ABR6FU38_9BURK|nr:MliC family protein [Paraburkholderia silvatlantica]MBB2930946.1 membrane-bound inhibitor of C-type lysozyme [Paraburkholderia silvatlantica]PVY27017.1 membrane-bound inhibitor of C-type lysozyme [Paraburkholderia silvatlantica]PXW33293.1 membrane-bound inhibitor of C-type lysozyme [Paraburkholderia silvatlantica]
MIDARSGAIRLAAVCGLAAALHVGAANAAHAANAAAPLEVRDIQVQSRHTFSYTCANSKTFKVTYLNAANGQSFALVPVDGRKRLFVGVIAASGVKYVADRYTWWTRGPGADLYDVTSDASPKPVLSGCATIMR